MPNTKTDGIDGMKSPDLRSVPEVFCQERNEDLRAFDEGADVGRVESTTAAVSAALSRVDGVSKSRHSLQLSIIPSDVASRLYVVPWCCWWSNNHSVVVQTAIGLQNLVKRKITETP